MLPTYHAFENYLHQILTIQLDSKADFLVLHLKEHKQCFEQALKKIFECILTLGFKKI